MCYFVITSLTTLINITLLEGADVVLNPQGISDKAHCLSEFAGKYYLIFQSPCYIQHCKTVILSFI